MVSFVVAMNRVDVVELVVDLVDVAPDVGLVDVDLDVDLVDVDLAVSLCNGPRSVLFGFVAPTWFIFFGPDHNLFSGVSSGSSGSIRACFFLP